MRSISLSRRSTIPVKLPEVAWNSMAAYHAVIESVLV